MILSRWYLVQTPPQQEKTARNSLAREGFRSLFPQVQFKGRSPQPLFSRYVFVFVDPYSPPPARMWRLHGVSRVIGGENPTPVQPGWVERLIPRLTDDGVLPLASPSDFLDFVPGDRVLVIKGLFEGLGGVCLWSTVSEVVIELLIAGSLSQRVRIPVSQISHDPVRVPEDQLASVL